jgi:alkanesulfonate monooxygenase SsuD/methylene tetrahydromethanopterin reductase-like flavin-dependent oxidoreductase (luciferase family)
MQLGALVPFTDTGGDPSLVRDFAQSLEALGYDFLEAPDHVLGANPGTTTGDDPRRAIANDMFHDPFVLLGYLASVTGNLTFSTGVLIVAQRQTVLVAKQAACLDVLSGGRFRLGIGVGWNPVEFTGLNENFHIRARHRAASRYGTAAITSTPCRASPNGATAGCPTPIRRISRHWMSSPNCAA